VIVRNEMEAPRPADGAGSSDAVTFAFGDAGADVFGVARIGLSGEPAVSSGLAILFSGGEAVAVRAAGGEAVADRAWAALTAAGVSTTIDEPLRAWTVRVAVDDGVGADLRFEAISQPSWLDGDSGVGRTGGMQGYEHVCRVTGTVTVAGTPVAIDCLGQRGHSWGAPDWETITRARTINAWLDDGLAVSLVAIAPAGRKAVNHDAEAIGAALFTRSPVLHDEDDGEDRDEAEREDASEPAELVALDVPEPRLSTVFDAEGRQQRAGFELVFDEDGSPRRGAGEARCGTSIDLGRLRLDCAFFTWRMEGRTGVGRYDVLRRT
jgi:hypothetical protein